MPYLSWQIHQHNLQALWNKEKTLYNLQGFIIVNGATDWDIDIDPAYPEVVYNFNIIPKHLVDTLKENDCHFYFNDLKVHNNSKICQPTWDEIKHLDKDLNWYDLFRKTYPNDLHALKSVNRLGESIVKGEVKKYTRGMTMKEYTPWAKRVVQSDNHPLLGAPMSDYINREDVREALNIPAEMPGWH